MQSDLIIFFSTIYTKYLIILVAGNNGPDQHSREFLTNHLHLLNAYCKPVLCDNKLESIREYSRRRAFILDRINYNNMYFLFQNSSGSFNNCMHAFYTLPHMMTHVSRLIELT